MDERWKEQPRLIRDKRGFALLITLSVLVVVLSLTAVLLSYFTAVKKDASRTQALIQANLFYNDIVAQFSKFEEKKTLFDQLYLFPVALDAAQGRFSMAVTCEPLAKGLNINWLAWEKNLKHKPHYDEAQRLFEQLAEEYNLEDPERLREMLLLEMGDSYKTITKMQSRLRQKEGIISYRQFQNIISAYQLEVDDLNVDKIQWQKYFSFLMGVDKIDAAYSSPELLSLLFDIDIQSVKEWTQSEDKTSLETFVTNNGGAYEEKKALFSEEKFLNLSHCDVHYGQGYHFGFDYIVGVGKHFEFYGKH